MAGVTFNAASFSKRLMEIESALNNPKKNKIVNDRAELINKENGFVRFLKIMVLPIARFFGADPFHHTRVHRVATTLIFQFLKLQHELTTEDRNRLGGIVTKLDEKTKHRYGNVMGVFHLIIQTPQNVPKPPPPPPPSVHTSKNIPAGKTAIPEKKLTKKSSSNPAELKLLADAMKDAATKKSSLKHVTQPEVKPKSDDTETKANPFGVKLNPVPESPKKDTGAKNAPATQNPFEVFGAKVKQEPVTLTNPADDRVDIIEEISDFNLFIDEKMEKLNEPIPFEPIPLFTILEINEEDGLFNANPITNE
jgi:hypothetical protein